MKRIFSIIFVFFAVFSIFNFSNHLNKKTSFAKTPQPKLAIVIDDFGSYDESGISTLMQAKIPLTCAVLPNTDNTQKHLDLLSQ